jgi:hypothetical protein
MIQKQSKKSHLAAIIMSQHFSAIFKQNQADGHDDQSEWQNSNNYYDDGDSIRLIKKKIFCLVTCF